MLYSDLSRQAKKWAKRGIAVSQEILEPPELFEELEDLYNLWGIVHGSRPISGAGYCPLPPSEWMAVLGFYGMLEDPEQAIETFELLLAADQKWVALKHGARGRPDGDSETSDRGDPG